MSKQLIAWSLALPSVSAVSYGGLQLCHFFSHSEIALFSSVLHNWIWLIEQHTDVNIATEFAFSVVSSSIGMEKIGTTVEGNTTTYIPGNIDMTTI